MKKLKGRRRRLVVYLTVSTTVFLVVSPGIASADEIVDPVDTTVTIDPATDVTVTVDPAPDTTVTDPTPDATVTDPTPDTTVTDPTPDATVTEPTPDTTVTDPTPDTTVTADPAPRPVSEPVADQIPTVVDEPAPDPVPRPVSEPIADQIPTVVDEPALDPVTDPASGPVPETALEPFPEVVSDPVEDPITDGVGGPTPETAIEPFPEVVTDPIVEPVTDVVGGPTPETAIEPFPEVVTDPVVEPVTDVVGGPTPETAIEPFPEVVTDPVVEPVTDPIPELMTDPVPELVEPVPGPIAEPVPAPIVEPIPAPIVEAIPAPIVEPIPAPVVVAPEAVAPTVVDEPMTATASTELFFTDEGPLPRITSEELPQKLQDDPFNAPQHEGIALSPAATVLMGSLGTAPSKAGSVQVDDPASCSLLGSAPCGVRNSPNDPGSFVQSIAELLRQLALTGSSALDLLKLALILAVVGAFAIWGTRRRPTGSVIEPRRTLRSGDLLHRYHGATANGSDRSDEWITVPHAVVRQRPTWRVPLARPRLEAATSGGSADRRSGGSSFVAGSAARLSICPTTKDRSAPASVPTHRGNGR